ncbi:MAG: glycosyltransferase family A protein [Akkermansia sp.]|nr:glycosyltransferase family A protein [Akkermansia sp.]
MSADSPLFSVVIPAYNARKFIPLTIESILRQSVQDFEIVVVNDGSTDDTLEILQGVADPRLRVITRENGGECVARNHGLREARGKYIAFLDSDDVWLPNHLEQALGFMEAHPDIAWFSSTMKTVQDIAPEDIQPADCSKERLRAVNWYLEGAAHTLPSTVTVRREEIQRYPHLFAEGYKMFGDNIGWCQLAKKRPMVGLSDTPTVLYRFWQGNASTTHNVSPHGVRSKAVQMALAKHAEFYREPDCPPEARLFYRHFALGNWWACISSAFLPKEWQADFAERKDVVGKSCTRWMQLWASVNRLTLCAMRWGVRMHKQSVERKIKRLAKASRIHFN